MNKKLLTYVAAVSVLIVAGVLAFSLGGPLFSRPEKPGTLSNPRMAQMLNEALDEEVRQIGDSIMYPGYIREADDNARLFLRSVKEVVSRCSGGRSDNSKFNKRVLDVTLADGTVLKGQYTGESCYYMIEEPNIYRVFFENGRVSDVQSDGREKNKPVDGFKTEAGSFAGNLLNVDVRRNRHRYFPEQKTADDFRREWEE